MLYPLGLGELKCNSDKIDINLFKKFSFKGLYLKITTCQHFLNFAEANVPGIFAWVPFEDVPVLIFII